MTKGKKVMVEVAIPWRDELKELDKEIRAKVAEVEFSSKMDITKRRPNKVYTALCAQGTWD